MKNRSYVRNSNLSRVTPELEAAIDEKVEQLGLDFRKMHDHAYNVFNVCIAK